MKRRRKERVVRNSMSCTDDEWARIRAAATAAGEGIGRHIVRRSLGDDPSPNATPRASQTLTPEEQRAMHDTILRLAGADPNPTAPDLSWMTVLPECVRLLCEDRILAAIRDGRYDELTARFRSAFGEDTGPVMMTAILDRRPWDRNRSD